jgi:hypothetical protein
MAAAPQERRRWRSDHCLAFIVCLLGSIGAAQRSRWTYCATDDTFKYLKHLNPTLNVLKGPSCADAPGDGGFVSAVRSATYCGNPRSELGREGSRGTGPGRPTDYRPEYVEFLECAEKGISLEATCGVLA